jgi:hypothetical protein
MHQEKPLLRRYLLDTVPIVRTKNIAATMLRTTMAGLCRLVIQLVAVVVGEFLAWLNIPHCDNPDDTPELFCVAIGLTRMVDIACRVLGRTPIKSVALVQSKDVDVASS